MADSLNIKYLTSVDGKPVGVDVAERDGDGNVIKDTYLKNSGGTMTGDLNLNSNNITNVGTISGTKFVNFGSSVQFSAAASLAANSIIENFTKDNAKNIVNQGYVDTKLQAKADLENGVIPASQLPSYVDDVIDFQYSYNGATWYASCAGTSINIGELCYNSANADYVPGGTSSPFYHSFTKKIKAPDATWLADPTAYKTEIIACLEAIAPETGKIYVGTSDSKTFRWSGSNLVEISKSISVNSSRGAGSVSTAYRSDFGVSNYNDILELQKAATSSSLGRVKLGSDTVQSVAANTVSTNSGRTYAIQKNSSDQLVVNVPWINTSNPGFTFYFSSSKERTQGYDVSGYWSITLYYADGTSSEHQVYVTGSLNKSNVVAASITSHLSTTTWIGVYTADSSGYVFSSSNGIQSSKASIPQTATSTKNDFLLLSDFVAKLTFEQESAE